MGQAGPRTRTRTDVQWFPRQRTLSSHALAALAEFNAEKDVHRQRFEQLKSEAEAEADGDGRDVQLSMDAFTEDWNKSQFWVTFSLSLFLSLLCPPSLLLSIHVYINSYFYLCLSLFVSISTSLCAFASLSLCPVISLSHTVSHNRPFFCSCISASASPYVFLCHCVSASASTSIFLLSLCIYPSPRPFIWSTSPNPV